MVRAVGLEPTRPYGLQILSLVCLPFHHARTVTLIGNPTKHLKPKIRYLHLLLPAVRLYRAKRAQKAKDCSSMLLAVAI